MKLSFKLALLNIRRYPLRILGSAVCLLLFGFALFSAVTFTRSLKSTVAEVLRSRSSGNTVLIKTDIGELENIKKTSDILEAVPYYLDNSFGFVSGEITIDGLGEFHINLHYDQSPDAKTLIPETYLNEFYALGGKEILVAGRMPEGSNEMIICESFCKSKHILNYDDILNKPAAVSHDFMFDEKVIDFENIQIVGIFSEDFLEITALSYYKFETDYYGSVSAFLVNPESKCRGIVAYCSIDKIDGVYSELCEKYGEDIVFESTGTSYAIEQLSGLHLFIGNLMYLAAAAIAFIYVMTRMVSTLNYFKEKSSFITATDAFGCGKTHILGAFAAENITLLIPVSVISAVLSCSFIKLIFRIISAYLGIELNLSIDLWAVLLAAVIMVIFEFLVLLMSFLLFRKKSND